MGGLRVGVGLGALEVVTLTVCDSPCASALWMRVESVLSCTQRRGTSRFLQTAGARISLHQMRTISLPLLLTAHRLLTFCSETKF